MWWENSFVAVKGYCSLQGKCNEAACEGSVGTGVLHSFSIRCRNIDDTFSIHKMWPESRDPMVGFSILPSMNVYSILDFRTAGSQHSYTAK